MIRAKPPSNPGATELILTVELDGADDALLRVLSTLHRRRCRVTAAEFGSDAHAPGQLALRVTAPSAHAGRIEHWLGSLIDVRRVTRISNPVATG